MGGLTPEIVGQHLECRSGAAGTTRGKTLIRQICRVAIAVIPHNFLVWVCLLIEEQGQQMGVETNRSNHAS